MDYPIQRPLDDKALIHYICNLYKKSVLPLLPFTILIVVMFHFVVLGQHFFAPEKRSLHMQIAMFLIVLMPFIVAAMVTVVHHIATARGYSYPLVSYHVFARVLSLFGSLISIALLPLIVLGLCVAIHLALGIYNAPLWSLFIFDQLIPIFVFAILVSRLFAPILVNTQNLDANLSVDESINLVKGYYWRTFIFTLFAFLLIVFLAKIPSLMIYYVPQTIALNEQIRQIIADVLLVLFMPWSVTCLIMQLEDLQIRRKAKPKPETEMKRADVTPKAKPTTDTHF